MSVERKEGTNIYRMVNFVEEEYDVVFTIDDNNRVFIEYQPCFVLSQYGVCYMIGFANGDDSGYAGDYDANTKTAQLTVRYKVDAGYFPVSYDVLIMP